VLREIAGLNCTSAVVRFGKTAGIRTVHVKDRRIKNCGSWNSWTGTVCERTVLG
jgi:hypothetical protein